MVGKCLISWNDLNVIYVCTNNSLGLGTERVRIADIGLMTSKIFAQSVCCNFLYFGTLPSWFDQLTGNRNLLFTFWCDRFCLCVNWFLCDNLVCSVELLIFRKFLTCYEKFCVSIWCIVWWFIRVSVGTNYVVCSFYWNCLKSFKYKV